MIPEECTPVGKLFMGVDRGVGPAKTVVAVYEQLDFLDEAGPVQVGIGGHRVGKSLRRLIDMAVVTLEPTEGGEVRIKATDEGRRILAVLRAHRLTI